MKDRWGGSTMVKGFLSKQAAAVITAVTPGAL